MGLKTTTLNLDVDSYLTDNKINFVVISASYFCVLLGFIFGSNSGYVEVFKFFLSVIIVYPQFHNFIMDPLKC